MDGDAFHQIFLEEEEEDQYRHQRGCGHGKGSAVIRHGAVVEHLQRICDGVGFRFVQVKQSAHEILPAGHEGQHGNRYQRRHDHGDNDTEKYTVPADLTIMTAMEYAGYTLKRGCGCRHGFCGACATIYRIKGDNELKTCLACQTQVQEGMYVASIPFFPTDKRLYNIEDLQPNQQVMMELYPEIYSCIGCNACTKACTQGLNVMQYIAYAQRGELEKCAEESFDCVSCGCCSVRCPAGISHPMVGLLARRLTGKYIAPKSEHLEKRVEEIHEGKYDDLIEQIMQKPITDMEELYNNREIEK